MHIQAARRLRHFAVGLLAWALLLVFADSAMGQEKADVGTLNDRAIKLSKEGMLGKAIEIWVELLEVTEAEYAYRWVFHKNVGRNFQKLGKLPRAWWHLAQAKKLAPEKGARKLAKRITRLEEALVADGYRRVTVTANRLGAIMPIEDELANWYPLPGIWWFKPGYVQFKVRSADGHVTTQSEAITADTDEVRAQVPAPVARGRLIVVASPPAAEIRVDGKLLGVGRVEIDVDEGDHKLAVTLSGYEPFIGTIGVLGSETEEEAVVLNRLPDLGTGQSSFHKWHWIALGSSLALVGAGCGTYWGWGQGAMDDQRNAHLAWVDALTSQGQAPTEQAKDDDWQRRVDNNVLPAEMTSYVLWGVGGAGLIATAVWMGVSATSPAELEEAARMPLIGPLTAPGSTGLTLQLSF